MNGLLPSEREELKQLEEMDIILKELYRLSQEQEGYEYSFTQFLPLLEPRHPTLTPGALEERIRKLFYKLDERPEEKKHVVVDRTYVPHISLTSAGERFVLDGKSYVSEFLDNKRKAHEKEQEAKADKRDKQVDRFLKYLSIPATILAIISGLAAWFTDNKANQLEERIHKLEQQIQIKDNNARLK
jgi:hypothetical protein